MPSEIQLRAELGDYVREVRNSLALTREDLAEKLGISPKTLKQAELGVYALGARPWKVVVEMGRKLSRMPILSKEAQQYASSLRDVASRIVRTNEVPSVTVTGAHGVYSQADIDAAIRLALNKEVVQKAEVAFKATGIDPVIIIREMLFKK